MLWQWHICHHGKPARSRRVCHGLVATRTCGLWLPWTRVQGGYFAQNKEEQKENLRKTDPIKVLNLTILLLFYPLFVSKRDQFSHMSNYLQFLQNTPQYFSWDNYIKACLCESEKEKMTINSPCAPPALFRQFLNLETAAIWALPALAGRLIARQNLWQSGKCCSDFKTMKLRYM